MEGAVNSIEVPYKIKFTNKNPVPIETIVTSLLAYEKIIKRIGPFIEEACDGLYIEDIDVLISKIESGSVIEDLVIRLIFKDEAHYKQAVEVISKMAEGNRILTGAVVVGVAAYIGFGIYNAVISQGNDAPTTHIEAHQGAIVQLGGTINISEEAIKRILYKTPDKKKLTKESIAAIAPAHLEKDATIEFNDGESATIQPGFIQESPRTYEIPEQNEAEKFYSNVEIEIWASDKDSSTRSWAGIVPGLINKRISFVLDEGVDPNKVHGSRYINADISILSSLPPGKKEFKPKKVTIYKIYNSKQKAEPAPKMQD